MSEDKKTTIQTTADTICHICGIRLGDEGRSTCSAAHGERFWGKPQTTEFLPCPFCGGDAIITEGDRVNQNAYCHGCDAQGPLVQVEYVQLSLVTDADTEAAAERARERWNQRVKNV